MALSPNTDIKVLAFDIFGTVVDWCGSIARQVEQRLPGVDGYEFARAWRAGYRPSMQKVMNGELGWTLIDDLHRLILDDVLNQFKVTHLTEAEKADLNMAWHRLAAWPDAVDGVTRLKSSFITTTLSNGNIALLVNMAKYAGLPWDCILSAETFQAYKPDPATYLGVANVFRVKPEHVMLVAAHQDDLDAARRCGLLTAYIERPLEFGSDRPKDVSAHPDNTFHATSLVHLADQLVGRD